MRRSCAVEFLARKVTGEHAAEGERRQLLVHWPSAARRRPVKSDVHGGAREDVGMEALGVLGRGAPSKVHKVCRVGGLRGNGLSLLCLSVSGAAIGPQTSLSAAPSAAPPLATAKRASSSKARTAVAMPRSKKQCRACLSKWACARLTR